MGYGGGGGGGGGSGGSGGSGGAGGGGGYTTVGGGSAFGGSDDFELPSYNQAPAGSIRFNTDSKKLEVYILGPVSDGVTPNGIWMEVDSWSPDLMTGGTRGIFAGGFPISDVIDYINLSSTGNAIVFDTLTNGAQMIGAGCGSRTRGLFGGQTQPTFVNTVDGVEISSTGSQFDYGDLSVARVFAAQFSNQTRGITAGGNIPGGSTATIDYFTIATSGTTAQDFGDLIHGGGGQQGACASSTRGVIMRANSPTNSLMEFVTISTLGNGSDFGDSHLQQGGAGGASNAVRGIFAGGYKSPATSYNNISYITIATLGNSQDFGDLTYSSGELAGCASPTRIAWGTRLSPGNGRDDAIQYLQIMTLGNTVDFGNLTSGRSGGGGTSNGHGGL
jgi:hypothetical protein